MDEKLVDSVTSALLSIHRTRTGNKPSGYLITEKDVAISLARVAISVIKNYNKVKD